MVKNPLTNAGDTGDAGPISWSGRSSGEGNSYPLQYSCLENPRDRGAWWAAVYGVAQSWTRLKRLSSSSSCVCMCAHTCAQLLTCVQLFVTPWTVGRQASLSMESFRKEYWSGLPFPTLWYLPHSGIKPTFLVSPTVAGRFFTTAPPGKPS